MADAPLLEIRDLTVAFGDTPAVHGISLELEAGRMLALVGESGSGKSVSAMSILRLLPDYAKVGGEVWLSQGLVSPSSSVARSASGSASRQEGREGSEIKKLNLLTLPERELRAIRGRRIGVIFQEPMTSLNPLHTIGKQLAEVIELHQPLLKREAIRARILELLKLVELEALVTRLTAYPHELSGGQRQRVMIAMALANNPDILIADEPTTALDVTVQATILNLIRKLQKELGMAVLLITHDLTIVERIADNVAVMHQGRIVENAPVKTLFANPQHDYTKKLLGSAPSGAPSPLPAGAQEVLRGENIRVHFPIKQGMLGRVRDYVKAVDGIDINLRRGETVGIVGESGSGKTTLGLGLLRLISSEGKIVVSGKEVTALNAKQLRPMRQHMQFVFQDPFSSLNPRMNIGQIIAEGLRAHGMGGDSEERLRLIGTALTDVGLTADMAARYPHEFSGGQRQRIGIARALVLNPELMVLDEPTSALDVSTQSDILRLLKKIQAEKNLSFLFISHDLRVIKSISHRVLVLRHGKVVEQGSREDIFGSPKEDYTKRLMQAAFEVK